MVVVVVVVGLRRRGFVVISRLPGLYLEPDTTTSTQLRFHAPPSGSPRHVWAAVKADVSATPFVRFFFSSELLSLSARPHPQSLRKLTLSRTAIHTEREGEVTL